MKKLPSKLYKLHGKGPGRAYSSADHKHSKKSTGAYEMNQFREMVVLSLVEMKREKADNVETRAEGRKFSIAV